MKDWRGDVSIPKLSQAESHSRSLSIAGNLRAERRRANCTNASAIKTPWARIITAACIHARIEGNK